MNVCSTPVDTRCFHHMCHIFNWVATTSLRDRAPGQQSSATRLTCIALNLYSWSRHIQLSFDTDHHDFSIYCEDRNTTPLWFVVTNHCDIDKPTTNLLIRGIQFCIVLDLIIHSEIWIISHHLRLSHETMVCTVLLWSYTLILKHIRVITAVLIRH